MPTALEKQLKFGRVNNAILRTVESEFLQIYCFPKEINLGKMMIKSKNFSESSFLRITFVFRELMKTKQKSQTISHHFILIRYDLY